MADQQVKQDSAASQQAIGLADSFRFLELPLELQRKILVEYFKKPWTIKPIFKRSSTSSPQELTWHYRFDINLNVLLGDHHVRKEVIDAVTACKNGTYKVSNADIKLLESRRWFFPAINKVHVNLNWEERNEASCMDVVDTVKLAREQFSNLERIDLALSLSDWFPPFFLFGNEPSAQVTVLKILQGEFNAQLCADAHEALEEHFQGNLFEALGSIPRFFEVWFYTRLLCDMPRSISARCNGEERDIRLWVRFEAANKGYRVTRMWLTNHSYQNRLEADQAIALLLTDTAQLV
jgi:hypothetical protein